LGDETRVYEAFPIEQYCIPQCFATLTGEVVTDETPTEPIEGATVTVETELWCGATWSASTTSNASGEYTLSPPGTEELQATAVYTVTASKTGYLPYPQTEGTAAVACEGATTAPDLVLYKGASISGVTFYEIGGDPGPDLPAELKVGATVEIFYNLTGLPVPDPASATGAPWTVTSDASAVYKFDGLVAETYDLKATSGSLVGTRTAVPVTKGQSLAAQNIQVQ